nr:hypothetical protein Iba_chr04aCG6390 [Ipomoea batatas]
MLPTHHYRRWSRVAERRCGRRSTIAALLSPKEERSPPPSPPSATHHRKTEGEWRRYYCWSNGRESTATCHRKARRRYARLFAIAGNHPHRCRHSCRRNFTEKRHPSLLPAKLPLLARETDRRSPKVHTLFAARASNLLSWDVTGHDLVTAAAVTNRGVPLRRAVLHRMNHGSPEMMEEWELFGRRSSLLALFPFKLEGDERQRWKAEEGDMRRRKISWLLGERRGTLVFTCCQPTITAAGVELPSTAAGGGPPSPPCSRRRRSEARRRRHHQPRTIERQRVNGVVTAAGRTEGNPPPPATARLDVATLGCLPSPVTTLTAAAILAGGTSRRIDSRRCCPRSCRCWPEKRTGDRRRFTRSSPLELAICCRGMSPATIPSPLLLSRTEESLRVALFFTE